MAESNITKISIELDKPNLDKFREIYPQRGMLTWFFNEVLRTFVDMHDPTKLHEDVKLAVEEALRK